MCFQAVDQTVIPPRAVWKALPGWICLTRRHACEIVTLNFGALGPGVDLVKSWGPGGQWQEDKGGVFAPEEVFFATMLALLGYLKDAPSGSSSSSSSSSTYSAQQQQQQRQQQQQIHEKQQNGSFSLYPHAPPPSHDQVSRCTVTYAEWKRVGDANPIAFEALTPSLLHKFRSSGALFARKFPKGTVSTKDWRDLVIDKGSDEIAPAIVDCDASLHNTASGATVDVVNCVLGDSIRDSNIAGSSKEDPDVTSVASPARGKKREREREMERERNEEDGQEEA